MNLREIKRFIHLSLFKNRFKTPPILIFFVTSACNAKCPHCFYKDNLNQKNDLSLAEIEKITRSMGKIYQLFLSGGEPFLRKDLAKICELFYKNNKVEDLQIPTNSLLAEKIPGEVEAILQKCPGMDLKLNLSLDGRELMHDTMRGVKGNFKKVMRNYESLASLKKIYKNLFINVVSTLTKKNIADLFHLADYVTVNMPLVSNHYLGYLRGRFYNQKTDLPERKKLIKLNKKIERFYRKKNNLIYTGLLREINKVRTEVLDKKQQIVPCLAGRLIGVIYEDGKIANCEMLPPTSRIRLGNFPEAWQQSKRIAQWKKIIKKRVCYCTHECFLSPSVVYRNPWKTIIAAI